MTTPIMHLDCDGFANAFADYLEGDASEAVRVAVESHAVSCESCRELLGDVNRIRAEAGALPALQPSRDLWSGIAERIDTRVIAIDPARQAVAPPGRRTWFIPAVAAAGLVALTAGITHFWTRAVLTAPAAQVAAAAPMATGEPTAQIVSTATERPFDTTVALASRRTGANGQVSAMTTMGSEERLYDDEIAKLRRIMQARHNDLDPKTVQVLQQSMAVIDSAIRQSRAALASDPASGFLAAQLNRSLENKVELLRTAVSLPARS